MAEDSSQKLPPSDDDRNLVVVDEDFANADAEDRLWLFWERNKDLLVRGTTAVVLAIIGAIGFHFWQESRREELGQAYVACTDADARRAFAAAHPGEPLAAVALLEVADDLRKANKLEDAAKAYEAAGKAVVGESKAVKAIATRARLYAALTRQELGQADAEAGIVAVAEDNSAPDTLRGYAMYVLANLALAKGDSATAAKWVNLMDKRLKPNHVWASDKAWLVRSEPSLLTPVSAPPALPAGK
ncbi:MAG: hypothetical protein NTX41_05900 [Verrucomicrobia bacterium]|nr:hypothetical protein [Verrucomicrobiota bacterium]